MTGDKACCIDLYVKLALENPHHGHAGGHECRLCILCQGKRFQRTVGHQGAQILTQRCVHFVKYSLGDCKLSGQLLAHAHGLATLAGKDKGEFHAPSLQSKFKLMAQ